MEKKECLLSVKNLNIGFEDKKTQQKVVTDFNLTIGFGEWGDSPHFSRSILEE